MNNKKVFIGNYEVLVLACCMFSFSNMVTLPMSLTILSHQDAWFTFLFAIPYGFFVAFLLYVLSRRMPGSNLFEVAKLACGKWIGSLLNIGLILFLFLELVFNLRLYSDYLNSSILHRTPPGFIILLTVCILFYYGQGSIQAVARSAVLYFPIFVALYVLIPFAFLNEIDTHYLQPALSQGSSLPLKGGVLGMGSFVQIIALGAFMNNVKSPRGFYVSLKSGVVISVFVLTIWLLLILTTLSHILASRFIYIGWILVQLIHITDFLDRVDLFIVSLWLPNLIINYCVLYLAILTGLSSFTKAKDYKPFNVLLGGIITITVLISFTNVGQAVKINDYGIIPFALLGQIVFFGAVFIGMALKKKKPIDSDPWKHGRIIWIALIGCAGSIGMSDILGSSRGIYGIICAALYFLCLIAVLLLSLREFKKLPTEEIKR